MRLLWLPHVLRLAGVNVVEMSGWEARGRELDAVHGVVWHHTASSVRTTDASMERMLVTGRPDLVGPLSQLGLRRDGTWVVVASGRANHNGYGTWGNSSIGIEAYNDGVGEPWPAVQVESYVNGTAAILRHLGLNTASVKGHKETDPRRKIDPAGLDMNQMRARIATRLTYVPPAPKPPTPTPTPIEQDNDMAIARRDPRDKKVWIIGGFGKWHVPSRDVLNVLALCGQIRKVDAADKLREDDLVAGWPADQVGLLDALPVVAHLSAGTS